MKLFTILGVFAALAAQSFGFSVNSDGSITTINVTPGTYRIFSSGTYVYDFHYDWSNADPEWMQLSDYNWYEYTPLDPTQKICDLSINELFYDWQGKQPGGEYVLHTFSASHNYMIEAYLSGDTEFQIYDPWYYYDNIGSVEVSLELVPEPTTLTIMGLVVLAFIKKRRKS